MKDTREALATKVVELGVKWSEALQEENPILTIKDLLILEFEVDAGFAKRVEQRIPMANPFVFDKENADVLFAVLTLMIGQVLEVNQAIELNLNGFNDGMALKKTRMHLADCIKKAQNMLILLHREDLLTSSSLS